MKIEKILLPFISFASVAIGIFFCVWYYPSTLIDENHVVYITMLTMHIVLSVLCFWIVYVFTDLSIKYFKGNAFTQRTCSLLKTSSITMVVDSVLFVILTIVDIVLGCISNIVGNTAILLFGLAIAAVLLILRNHVNEVIKDKEELEGTV